MEIENKWVLICRGGYKRDQRKKGRFVIKAKLDAIQTCGCGSDVWSKSYQRRERNKKSGKETDSCGIGEQSFKFGIPGSEVAVISTVNLNQKSPDNSWYGRTEVRREIGSVSPIIAEV